MGSRTHVRSDARRSRARLIEGVQQLLTAGELDFSIPELAAASGVGVATAYRHFPTPSDAVGGAYSATIAELITAFGEVDKDLDPLARFDAFCAAWIHQARRWGPAVRHIRSHQGFLERVRAGDTSIVAIYDALDGVLDDLEVAGLMPRDDRDAAILMWVTVFDERVVYDLEHHHGWDGPRISAYMNRAVKGALRIHES